jgi:hypothetical protein
MMNGMTGPKESYVKVMPEVQRNECIFGRRGAAGQSRTTQVIQAKLLRGCA